MCENLEVLLKLCEKSRCFPGKFTKLAQILHDCRSWRSRQTLTLATQSSNTFTWSCHKFHFDQVIQVMMIYILSWNCLSLTYCCEIVYLRVNNWSFQHLLREFRVQFLFVYFRLSLTKVFFFWLSLMYFWRKYFELFIFHLLQWRSYSLKTGNDVVTFQRGQYSRNWFHPFFWPSPRHIQHLFSNISIFPI